MILCQQIHINYCYNDGKQNRSLPTEFVEIIVKRKWIFASNTYIIFDKIIMIVILIMIIAKITIVFQLCLQLVL